MPWAGRPQSPPTFLESVVPLLDAPFHPAGVAVAQIVTLPGQVLVSFALVLLAARHLSRRGRAAAAVSWPVAWVSAVAVELVCRHVLSRPPLYRDGAHLVGLDSSWPSGHALRCALVAAALAAAWPRLRVLLGIWFVASLVLLALAGFHTPTDIAGGLLLAALAAAGAGELGRSGLGGRRAALRRRAALGRAPTRS